MIELTNAETDELFWFNVHRIKIMKDRMEGGRRVHTVIIDDTYDDKHYIVKESAEQIVGKIENYERRIRR